MSFVLVLMVLLPLAAALAVALIGDARALLVRQVSLAATIAVLVLAVVLMASYRANPAPTPDGSAIRPQFETKVKWLSFSMPGTAEHGPRQTSLEFHLGIDGLSLWLVGLTALLLVSSVLVSWEAITDRVARYHALLLLLESGLIGVFCAFDLVLFYTFFEFTLIPLFFLIGMWGGPQKEYAAKKFFIYTLSGSVISLLGLVALVLALHAREPGTLTFSIPELADGVARQMQIIRGVGADGAPISPQVQADAAQFWYYAQVWIFLALFVGFAIKVPLFPFHTWLPLAHVEAPTAGSVLLAGVLLKLGSYGFLRLCLPLLPFGVQNIGAPLFAILSVIGILYGSLCALAQQDIKKLVAYSSVAHLGFCMLGLAALNEEGITGSTLQMINHGLSTGALFLLVGMVYERYHTRMLGELGGIATRLPYLSFFMVLTCLSSVGLPGLNGFVGELLSVIGMYKANKLYAGMALVGIILGAWYLLNLLREGFFGPATHLHGDSPTVGDLKPREWAALVPIAALFLLIGLFPQPFVRAMEPDVAAIARPYQTHEKTKWLAPPAPTVTALAENR